MNARTWMAGVALLAAGLGAGFLAGRRAPGVDEPGSDDSPVLARFKGGQITARELRARIDAQGAVLKQQLSGAEARRKFLDELVQERLVAATARAKGLDRAPEPQAACARALTDAFLRAEVEAPLAARPATDDELRAYFQAHRAEYARPAEARVAHLFVAAKEGAPDREKKAAQARDLLAQARARLAKDYGGFAALAREKSEDPTTRPLGGELRPATREALEQSFGKAFADAAFGATAPGQLVDQVLESKAGFHVVQVLDRQAALDPSFEVLKEALRPRLLAERRTAEQDRLYQQLVREAEVKVDSAALAAMDLSAAR